MATNVLEPKANQVQVCICGNIFSKPIFLYTTGKNQAQTIKYELITYTSNESITRNVNMNNEWKGFV